MTKISGNTPNEETITIGADAQSGITFQVPIAEALEGSIHPDQLI